MSDQSDVGAKAPPMFGFIRSPQDFFGGLVLIAVSLFAFYAGDDLSGMHGFSFGPGTAPRLFSSLLLGFGVLITVMGVLLSGPRLEPWAIRGTILTIASILVFAATIRSAGLIISSFVSFMIGAYATDEVRWWGRRWSVRGSRSDARSCSRTSSTCRSNSGRSSSRAHT
jgi:putative tricarboxylic transport membrane protein